MIKTLTLDGLTSVTIKQSAYDMARFCWLYNHSESDIFASCVNSECTENADNVLRIPAGEPRMLDTESYETLYLNGSGTVEFITSAYSVCPFGEGKKGGGASLSGSAAYTINNAVDYPLMGLNLYGKSTQDGTPTPDTPVDIVSVGDNGFDIVSQGDNDFVLISCRNNNSIITKQPDSAAVKVGKNAVFTVAATGEGLKYRWQYSTDSGNTWKNFSPVTASFTINIVQASYNGWQYRCIVTDANGKSVTTNTATLYVVPDDVTAKSGSVVLPDVLCGIPVGSDVNHTDKNGHQWICDTLVYNADGTGKIIKRTAKIDSYNGEAITTPYISTTGALTTGAAVIYQLDTPQISILSTTDVMALSALQTYSGATTISNNGNVDMVISYCTDKSLSEYVMPVITNMQAQIDELKSAVLSLGGNI